MTTNNSTVAKLDKASQNTYDALIVGAAFAGMYRLYQLRSLGFTAVHYTHLTLQTKA